MIVNQPEILPWVAPGHLRLDMEPFFERPGNLMLGDARGVVLFAPLENGFYTAHFLFTSSLRGRDALRTIRAAFTALFTYRDALAITGAIPREHRASRAMVRALGCRPIGECVDSHGRSCVTYIMERKTWAT